MAAVKRVRGGEQRRADRPSSARRSQLLPMLACPRYDQQFGAIIVCGRFRALMPRANAIGTAEINSDDGGYSERRRESIPRDATICGHVVSNDVITITPGCESTHRHRLALGEIAAAGRASCAFRPDRYFKSSNRSSRRITGRMNTKSVESSLFCERVPNSILEDRDIAEHRESC